MKVDEITKQKRYYTCLFAPSYYCCCWCCFIQLSSFAIAVDSNGFPYLLCTLRWEICLSQKNTLCTHIICHLIYLMWIFDLHIMPCFYLIQIYVFWIQNFPVKRILRVVEFYWLCYFMKREGQGLVWEILVLMHLSE